MSNYYGLHTAIEDRDLSRMAAERFQLLQAVEERRSQSRRPRKKSVSLWTVRSWMRRSSTPSATA